MYNIFTGYAECGQYAHVHSGGRRNAISFYYYHPFIIKRLPLVDKTSGIIQRIFTMLCDCLENLAYNLGRFITITDGVYDTS